MTDRESSRPDPSARWEDEQTTFQRVYDVLVGTTEPASAGQFAERARCSETAARQALSQLVEMGIADESGTRPVRYRRNPSYFRWRRVERLARDHDASELRSRLEELVERDRALQEAYDAPDPDAVVESGDVDEPYAEAADRWEELAEWRTIRRDVAVLKRAVRRTTSSGDARADV